MNGNDVIYETVVTTVSASGAVHVAPMGVRYRRGDGSGDGGGDIILMPFRPSTTLDNVVATGAAVLNIVVDTRVFAGCVTGRKQWPTVAAERVDGVRLACALSHIELGCAAQHENGPRSVLRMTRVHEVRHAPFIGLNRAQAAVVEGAVLVSRLHMLPMAKIETEMNYLQIAVDKTAGPEEHEAWGWLQDAVAHHRLTQETR